MNLKRLRKLFRQYEGKRRSKLVKRAKVIVTGMKFWTRFHLAKITVQVYFTDDHRWDEISTLVWEAVAKKTGHHLSAAKINFRVSE